MSPEQSTGMKVDRHSDICSLGVLLYEMLTGERPITGKNISKLVQIHHNNPIPKLTAQLSKYQSLLEDMLAKDPDKHSQTADELISGINWIEQS